MVFRSRLRDKYLLRSLRFFKGFTRLGRTGRMTWKVRRDFKKITDLWSPVSLVTSNIRGSSICSPKSQYKKTSTEILVLWYIFTLCSVGREKSTRQQILFIFHKFWSSRQDKAVFYHLEFPENFVHLFLRTDSGLYMYHLLLWLNFNLLHIFFYFESFSH